MEISIGFYTFGIILSHVVMWGMVLWINRGHAADNV